MITRLGSRLRSVAGRVRSAYIGRFKQSRDPNFIGFDKYEKLGAYHWRELEENADYRAKLDVLLGLVDPEARCLDLGCGDGAYMYALARRCHEVVGVDADYSAVKVANRQFETSGARNARSLQLPLSAVTLAALDAGAGFDVVYSMDVIEHLPEPGELLEVAQRMASDDAVIVIGTPLYISDALVSPYHVREFRKEEIREIIDAHLGRSDEVILPMERKDGEVYDEGFYIAVCRKP